MEVAKSAYLTILHDNEKELLEFVWQDTSNLNDREFRKNLEMERDFVIKFKPKRILLHTQTFRMTISVETQNWVNNEVLIPWAKAGVKKVAFLMTEEWIAQLSIEQAMNEDTLHKFDTKYFKSKKEALVWLLA
ncbi:hypothetical protein [Flexithrix dorotheae]|uniref:hypothetical protein n=1 Tax=Flexithrix dorotheae TaxID=70993 RepID=UPI0003643962|nr:hypothetical protein [Flexithrix dorotheae]